MATSLTLGEKLSLVTKLLPLPAIVIYTTLISPFSKPLKKKKLYRLIHETCVRTILKAGSVRQLQWLWGTTTPGNYMKWAKKFKVEPLKEEVPQSGKKLMWIGDKNAEKVVFYIHGGCMVALSDFMSTFWLYVQRDYVKRTGKEISICLMEYSLHPQVFPTQLTEIVHAFSYFLSNTKATPCNIHLAGDSAGGNLLVQFISHTLHPVDRVPSSPLTTTRIRGTLLVSPWLSLNEETPSHVQNDLSDWLPASALIVWGNNFLEGVKDSHLPYVKTLSAGERWFEGVGKVTERIFVTVGDAECLLEDGKKIYKLLSGAAVEGRPEMKLDVEEGGVHDDMMIECGAGGQKLTGVGEKIVEWLMESDGDAH
ncbi:alpha/beta-hydrolase [Marasmius fiardii PR-910]|nr:alpha/beta-hydrolase [Marasmius fiardii PR-910]